jgi:hypothetical protein
LRVFSHRCLEQEAVAAEFRIDMPRASTQVFDGYIDLWAARGIVGNAAARGRCTVTITVTPHPPDHDKWH